MSDRLCAFAKNSDPNTGDYIQWQAGGKQAIAWGDEDTAVKNPSSFKLWKTMFTNEAPGE